MFEKLSEKPVAEVQKEQVAEWNEENLLKKCVDAREGKPQFVFYEGPPTANGKPGIHHVMARTLKDSINRYKTMQGFQVNRKAGWDTHGLPVEIEVEKQLPIASSYSMALFFVGILGLGTSSFHPQGHGLAGAVGGPARLGSYLAVFAAAGTLGAALSPLYAVFLLSVLGASRIPVALFFVLVFLLAVRIWIPKSTHGRRERESNKGFPPRLLGSMWVVVKLCFGLIVISIVRDSTFQGIRVFLPLLVTGRGGSLEMGGTVLFTFTLAGTISNLIGGKLGDVFGKTRIIVIMLCLSPLFLFPAIRTSGALSIALFVLGGACITATNPITLALAQEYVPQFRSTASSFVMGVAWGIANIVASPIGMLADRIGLEPTLGFLALMPLFVVTGIGMARLFGRRRAT